MTTRRQILVGAGAAATLVACQESVPSSRRADVVAAGQPAALLMWAVARDRLAGWPRRLNEQALAALPPSAASLPELGAMASRGGRPVDLEAIAALKPALVIDYGDTDASHLALAERMKGRLGVEWHLLDGSLTRIPVALRKAAAILERGTTVEPLALQADEILRRWQSAPSGPSFYYARGEDGLETGFKGALATEVLEGADWTNLANGGEDIGRVEREQVADWDPEAIVTLSARFAKAALQDDMWKWRRNGSRRRILVVPDMPFGWIDRPPSVNRLLGCAWLAESQANPVQMTLLSRRLYGLAPVEVTLPQWIA